MDYVVSDTKEHRQKHYLSTFLPLWLCIQQQMLKKEDRKLIWCRTKKEKSQTAINWYGEEIAPVVWKAEIKQLWTQSGGRTCGWSCYYSKCVIAIKQCLLPSAWEDTLRWGRSEGLSYSSSLIRQLAAVITCYHLFHNCLSCLPPPPMPQTTRFISVKAELSSAIGRVNRNCCLFPTLPPSSYLISETQACLFRPLKPWRPIQNPH